MAPKELGINFVDNHFEILVIILAVIISTVLISIVIYAVKLRTINSAIRSEEVDDDPQPSTSVSYRPLTPSLSCPNNLPIAGTSTSFLTVPGITRTY